jgi:hypothetical protein
MGPQFWLLTVQRTAWDLGMAHSSMMGERKVLQKVNRLLCPLKLL